MNQSKKIGQIHESSMKLSNIRNDRLLLAKIKSMPFMKIEGFGGDGISEKVSLDDDLKERILEFIFEYLDEREDEIVRDLTEDLKNL